MSYSGVKFVMFVAPNPKQKNMYKLSMNYEIYPAVLFVEFLRS